MGINITKPNLSCSPKIIAQVTAIFFVTTFGATLTTHAAPYVDVGTSVGTIVNGNSLAGQTLAGGLGFVGSFNFYIPVTPTRLPSHLDIGLQNRYTILAGSSPTVTLITPNFGVRLELWRFYAGVGGSPYVLVNMKPVTGAYSYFGEGGLIWRIVPEFQICATVAMEFVSVGGSLGPSPSTEFGLRFRFPLWIDKGADVNSVKFDGFRYPFGVMR